MKAALTALLCQLLFVALATAQPVTGSGAEVAWFTPKEGAVLDLVAGTERTTGLSGPRRLPAQGWLATRVHPGELVWVRILDAKEGAAEPESVRFAYLSGDRDGSTIVDAVPERRSAGNFLFMAPIGPPVWLGVGVRAGHPAPRAQLWVGGVTSPGFRWELWEEQAKKWAANPLKPPPLPPDLSSEPLIEKLSLIQDAVALAQEESQIKKPAAISALLRAEALLANLPARELLFPYYRRWDLTGALTTAARKSRRIDGQRVLEVRESEPLDFFVEGPAVIRIETRARFDVNESFHAVPLQLVLSSGNRILAQSSEQVTPAMQIDGESTSTVRRLMHTAAPGRHSYELVVHGGPVWVSIITHTRAIHAEDLSSHSEDIPWLLQRTGGAAGVLAELLAAETSFLSLEDDKARSSFLGVLKDARSRRLQAFALRRLAALTPQRGRAAQVTERALALLDDNQDAAAVKLRNVLVAEHLSRLIADSTPVDGAPKEAVAMLKRNPGALPYMLDVVGPLLRFAPSERPLALSLLADALHHAPLDENLRHSLMHEWFTGSRWAVLPTTEMTGAQRVELLSPARPSLSCAEAGIEGIKAYAPLPNAEVALVVSKSLAPPSSLHRFRLIVLRNGAPAVGSAELILDGTRTTVPLLLPTESIPFALSAGRHRLKIVMKKDSATSLLLPCELFEATPRDPLISESHFSELEGRGAKTRVVVTAPGNSGFLGVVLRPSPALRSGRLLLLTDQGTLGTIEVYGHGIDGKVIGRTVGPAITVVFPLPAATRVLELVRQDDGPPLLVSAFLRHSLAAEPAVPLSLLELQPGQNQLERLRQATRALRHATSAAEVARARMHRAEVLLALDARALAHRDLERAQPPWDDNAAVEKLRGLLTLLSQPLLPVRQAGVGGRQAIILAAGADLDTSGVESACVNEALIYFAAAPAAGRTAAAKCPGPLGPYAAARMEEQGGLLDRAARHYAAAYLRSLAAGHNHPALAREAALRLAEHGPGPEVLDLMAPALSWATAAAQDGDPEGDMAISRIRGFSHLRGIRGVDDGDEIELDEHDVPPLSLRAALADEPWNAGMFLEVGSGKSAETDFQLTRAMTVRLEALCDDQGEQAGVAPPCNLRVEVDGTPWNKQPTRTLRAGEQALMAEVPLERGAHRIKVALELQNPASSLFIHYSSSRPLHGRSEHSEPSDDPAYFSVAITSPPPRRFIGTPEEPVRLRAQGSTVVRVDVLGAPSKEARALAVELEFDGQKPIKRTYPICTPQAEPLPLPRPAPKKPKAYDCRTVLFLPLLWEGTYHITARPLGTANVALALALYEDNPITDATEEGGEPRRVADESAAPGPIPGARIPSLPLLLPPLSNFVRSLGTLQVQQLGVFGTAGHRNPQIGDNYAETDIYYRRKLEDLPIWLRTGMMLHLRNGSPALGLDGLFFARIPPIQLRVYSQFSAFTQSIDENQEYGFRLRSYVERSFAVVPHFYILPRFAFNANYQSLSAFPKPNDPSSTLTPVDPFVFSQFEVNHRTGIYGQLLLWWVPFINMIVFAQGRLVSNQSVHQIDSVGGRAAFDVALYTTEISAYYDLTQFLADDARSNAVLQHTLAMQVTHTVWLHRNHRLGLEFGVNLNLPSKATNFTLGAFWEGSHGRGLDDYSTPEVNLPQQIGRGRGYLKPEETLR